MTMKKYFNSKQIKKLKAAEPYFTTVVKSQYKRATTIAMNDMVADMYDSVSGKQPISRNYSCNTCVYNLYLACGRLYFESIEQVENKIEPEQESNKLDKKDTDK